MSAVTFFITLVLLSTTALAQESTNTSLLNSNERLGMQWLRAGAYYTHYFQKNEAESNSGLLFYSPVFRMSERWSLTTDLGFTYIKPQLGDNFFIYILDERLDFRINKTLSVDLNLGLQNWSVQNSTFASMGLGGSYHLDIKKIPELQALRAGISYVANTDFDTWQFILGLDFSLERKLNNPSEHLAPNNSSPKELFEQEQIDNLNLQITHFRLNQAELSPTDKDYLRRVATALKDEEPDLVSVVITGHTDELGTVELNKSLSTARAESVVTIFLNAGITKDKIQFRGLGSSEPLQSKDPRQPKNLNRRVETVLSFKKRDLSHFIKKIKSFSDSQDGSK